MGRYVPTIVILGMLTIGVAVTLQTVEADKESCHASALSIVRGAHVPEKIHEKCEEEAHKEMLIGGLPFGGGVVAWILKAAILRGDDEEADDSAGDDDGGH